MKRLFSFSFAVLMLVTCLSNLALAAAIPLSGKDYPIADLNNDKIYEDLARAMEETADIQEFDVIVAFNEEYNIQGLKNAIGDFTTKYAYQNIYAIAARLNKGQINALSKHKSVDHIQLDGKVKACMSTASSWFGVSKARIDFGVTGNKDGYPTAYSKNDIVVAVIDSGIDITHVDLDGGKVIAWKDFINSGTTTPYDDNGHGTHCASIIAGTGEGNSSYKGIAYGAALVGCKVLDSTGSGSMSYIDAAIDWCITNRVTYNIKVISLSLTSTGSSAGTSTTCQLIEKAFLNGIVSIVSAGNEGPNPYTIGDPAAASKAITVGAMGDPGETGFFLGYFSGRGYTASGALKPDICGPGYNVMAAKAASTNQYITMSGSSVATPFVAGTVALMLAANPYLTPNEIKTKLTTTAQDWGNVGADINYGYGRLQAYDAIKSAGGYSGTSPAVPAHLAKTDALGGTGKYDMYNLSITSTAYPIAITMIMDTTTTDFDIYLYNPSGNKVAYGEGTTRQETVTFNPTLTGTYQIKVISYSGSGGYILDISSNTSTLIMTVDQ